MKTSGNRREHLTSFSRVASSMIVECYVKEGEMFLTWYNRVLSKQYFAKSLNSAVCYKLCNKCRESFNYLWMGIFRTVRRLESSDSEGVPPFILFNKELGDTKI